MTWTRELPTEPGYYWWVGSEGERPEPVQVCRSAETGELYLGSLWNAQSYKLDDMLGWWLPLEEPK